MSYFTNITALPPELAAGLTGLVNGKTALVWSILGGRSRGWNSTSVFGDCCEYLDTTQDNMNTPTTGQTLYLVSTNAADAAAGTGARTVQTVYLDASGNIQSRTGYAGYLVAWSAAAINTTMDTRLRADVKAYDRSLSAGAVHFQSRVWLSSGQNSESPLHYLKLPAGTVAKVSAIPGNAPAGNKLDCSFAVLLVAV